MGRVKFAERTLTKKDVLVVTGDFGFIWNGDSAERKILKLIGKSKFPVLFADGAHENFALLETYPETAFAGGIVRKISGNLYYAKRGEVYSFTRTVKPVKTKDGNTPKPYEKTETVLVFGGEFGSAYIDNPYAEYNSDIINDIPTSEDLENALDNLAKQNFAVDFIVSYDAPTIVADGIETAVHFNKPLDIIAERAAFNRWFFGKYHINRTAANKYFAMYDKITSATAPVGEFNLRKNANVKK
jgi:hypothetical protein